MLTNLDAQWLEDFARRTEGLAPADAFRLRTIAQHIQRLDDRTGGFTEGVITATQRIYGRTNIPSGARPGLNAPEIAKALDLAPVTKVPMGKRALDPTEPIRRQKPHPRPRPKSKLLDEELQKALDKLELNL